LRAATLATPDHLTPGPSRPCRKNVSTATLEKPRIATDVNIPTCGIPCQGTFTRRLKEDVAGEPEVPRGAVRVGAGEGARIREAYPSLALEVRNQRDMESFDQLLAGELDLAVRSREALPHGLRFEPLFASDRMLIVPRGHELAGKKRPTLRDLARHAFVIPPAGSTSRRLIEAAFLRAGLRLEIAMEAGGWMSMGW